MKKFKTEHENREHDPIAPSLSHWHIGMIPLSLGSSMWWWVQTRRKGILFYFRCYVELLRRYVTFQPTLNNFSSDYRVPSLYFLLQYVLKGQDFPALLIGQIVSQSLVGDVIMLHTLNFLWRKKVLKTPRVILMSCYHHA